MLQPAASAFTCGISHGPACGTSGLLGRAARVLLTGQGQPGEPAGDGRGEVSGRMGPAGALEECKHRFLCGKRKRGPQDFGNASQGLLCDGVVVQRWSVVCRYSCRRRCLTAEATLPSRCSRLPSGRKRHRYRCYPQHHQQAAATAGGHGVQPAPHRGQARGQGHHAQGPGHQQLGPAHHGVSAAGVPQNILMLQVAYGQTVPARHAMQTVQAWQLMLGQDFPLPTNILTLKTPTPRFPCPCSWPRVYSRSPSSTSASIDRLLSGSGTMSHGPGSLHNTTSVGQAITGSRRERPLSAHSNATEVFAK